MSCWHILGIEKTTNLNVIREAYTSLVKSFRPDTHPEEFKNIREAFEEARKSVEESSKESRTSSDEKQERLKVFLDKLRVLCEDFKSRINEDSWNRLFSDEIIWDLELKPTISVNLFNIIAHFPPLPKSIYELLDSTFNWRESLSTLEQYLEEPKINYVLSNIVRSSWDLGHETLEELTSESANKFYNARYQGRDALVKKDFDMAENYFQEANTISPNQPDVLLLLGYLYTQNHQLSKAKEHFLKLSENSNSSLCADGYINLAEISFQSGKYSEAIVYFEAASNIIPLDETPRYADCFYFLNQYEKAKELYISRLKKCRYDHYSVKQLMKVNVILIDIYKSNLRSGREEYIGDNIMRLADCYVDLMQFERSTNILIKNIDKINEEDKPRAYHLIATSYVELDSHNEAKKYYKLCYDSLKFFPNIENYNFKSNDYFISSIIALSDYSLAENDFINSKNYLGRSLELLPTNDISYFKLGEIEHGKSDFKSAIINFSKAISIKNDNPKYFISRATSYGALGMWREQAEDYKAALKYDYMNSFIWGELGRAYIDLEEFENAKQALVNSVNEDFYLGILYLKKNEYKTAIYHFSKYLNDFPDHINAYINRAKAYSALEMWSEKAKDYEALVELQPNNEDYWVELGHTYRELAEYDKAKSAYASSSDEKFYLGILDYKLKDYPSSLENFSTYIEAYPNADGAYYQRSKVYKALGAWLESAEDLTTYASLNPKDVAVYEAIGQAYHYAKEFEKAKAAYARHPNANQLLADFHFCINELEVGMDYLMMVKKSNPNSFNYHQRGNIYCRLGQWEKALEDYRICVNYWPDNQYYKQDLLRVSVIVGNIEEALTLVPTTESGEVVFCQSLNESKQHKLCIKYSSLYLESSPLEVKLLEARASSYGETGAFCLQLEDINTLIKLSSFPEEYNEILGNAYVSLGEVEKAKNAYENTFDKEINLSRMYCKLQDYEKSLLHCNNYINEDVNEPLGYFERSKIYSSMGDNASAQIDIDKVKSLEIKYHGRPGIYTHMLDPSNDYLHDIYL